MLPEKLRYVELITTTTRDKLDIIREIWPELANPKSKLTRLNNDSEVQKEIERRQEVNKFIVPYTEVDVIEGLLEISRDISTKASDKINALVWLGKHIGMFREKDTSKETGNVTYNIVNFKDSDFKSMKKVEGELLENEDE